MGRKRDSNRDKAFEIYKASGGEIRLIDIASQLEVSEGTVGGWKTILSDHGSNSWHTVRRIQ